MRDSRIPRGSRIRWIILTAGSCSRYSSASAMVSLTTFCTMALELTHLNGAINEIDKVGTCKHKTRSPTHPHLTPASIKPDPPHTPHISATIWSSRKYASESFIGDPLLPLPTGSIPVVILPHHSILQLASGARVDRPVSKFCRHALVFLADLAYIAGCLFGVFVVR